MRVSFAKRFSSKENKRNIVANKDAVAKEVISWVGKYDNVIAIICQSAHVQFLTLLLLFLFTDGFNLHSCHNRNVIEINIREQRIEFNSWAERKIQAPDICISDDKRE